MNECPVDQFVMRKTPNKGLRPRRVKFNKRELAFAEHWADECEVNSFVGNRQGLVQDLFIYHSEKRPFEPAKMIELTRRERMIAATVVQWFGTNCGWFFLSEVLRKCGYKIVKTEESLK